MEDSPKRESRWLKVGKLLLKIIITGLCLWYVSGKIDFSKAGAALSQANWWSLIVALLAFVISKIFSAFRINIYFANIGISLSQWSNCKLYWLGMFYNLFLPGSISGDAYKVILLTKHYGVPYRKTAAAVVLDRFSGLLGLGLILAVYSALVVKETRWVIVIAIGAVLGVVACFVVVRYWQRDFLTSFGSTLLWGIAVQGMQVISVYLIMHALHMRENHQAYIFLFLMSSVVAVLPLTVGGLGAREIVFLKGSIYLGLLQENSVVISILFYLITLFTSAWGMLYVFRDPLNRKRTRIESLNLS